jgi:hypothetical protein
MRVGPTSAARSLGDRGKLVNYKFGGDLVLGKNLLVGLSIYRPIPRPVSLESDHEMVIATFSSIPMAGGRRRKGRKTQKKNRKAKKSRKVKRHNH